jgi:apolipoprotein N-acyltransferase
MTTRLWNISSEYSGIIYVTIASLCGAFGNSLEPVSVLAMGQSFFLLLGFYCNINYSSRHQDVNKNEVATGFNPRNISIAIAFTAVYVGFAMLMGFMSVFGYPKTTALTIFMTYLLGFGIGLVIAFFALLPQYWYTMKLPRYPLTVCVYPAGLCVIYHSILGRTFSTFPCLANTVLDFGPLREFANLFGIISIEYLVAFICSIGYHRVIFDREQRDSFNVPEANLSQPKALKSVKYIVNLSFLLCCIVFVVTGFLAVSDRFYQKNVSELVSSYSSMSCMFAQDERNATDSWTQLWTGTDERLAAGDALVLWAEESVDIFSDEEEQSLLDQASSLAKKYNNGYIGITFKKITSSKTTNQFALITSDGSIAWNYQKAHPVLLVESDITPGPSILPTYDGSSGVFKSLRLGGAICFDLDFPSFIVQASWKQVDILLQPSWTWNAIDVRHFDGNAVRALENGFTLFRCSSDGQSGVVSSRGVFLSRRISLDSPADGPMVFQVPISHGQRTVYGSVGFILEYLMIVFWSILMLQMLLLEVMSWHRSYASSDSTSVVGYLVRYSDSLVLKYGPEISHDMGRMSLMQESAVINDFHTFPSSSRGFGSELE